MANNWAIVVGINHYDFLPNASLKFAAADALAMRKFLCEEAGFDAEKVLLCGDGQVAGSQKATKAILRDILLKKLTYAHDADNLWFFFSGHGMAGKDKQDYLLTIDGNPDDLKATAISTHFVADQLRACKAKNIVLVLDMCRNEDRDSERKSVALQREKQQGMITMHSCDRGQFSYEISELEQGAFTHALLEGLREKKPTLRDLAIYLEFRVPALHKLVGRAEREQTPRVAPDPFWKLDKSILFPYEIEIDIAALMGKAIDAESDGDFKKALNLWEEVKEATKSDADRSRAIKKIADLRKRLTPLKIVSQPSTPKPAAKIPSQENPVAKWDFVKKTVDRSPLPTSIPTVKKPVSQQSQPPLVTQVQKSQPPEVKPTPAPAVREIKATQVPPIVSAPPRKVDRPKNTFTRHKMLYLGLGGLGAGGAIALGLNNSRQIPATSRPSPWEHLTFAVSINTQ
jgi:Caspase domain